MRPDKGCIYKRCVSVPEGMSIYEARMILERSAADLRAAAAIEEAVPEGSWSGRVVMENLRAAGYDVVRAAR